MSTSLLSQRSVLAVAAVLTAVACASPRSNGLHFGDLRGQMARMIAPAETQTPVSRASPDNAEAAPIAPPAHPRVAEARSGAPALEASEAAASTLAAEAPKADNNKLEIKADAAPAPASAGTSGSMAQAPAAPKKAVTPPPALPAIPAPPPLATAPQKPAAPTATGSQTFVAPAPAPAPARPRAQQGDSASKPALIGANANSAWIRLSPTETLRVAVGDTVPGLGRVVSVQKTGVRLDSGITITE